MQKAEVNIPFDSSLRKTRDCRVDPQTGSYTPQMDTRAQNREPLYMNRPVLPHSGEPKGAFTLPTLSS